MATGSIWRPPQWKNSSSATISLNVPAQPNSGQYSSSGSPATVPSGLFVFDAVMQLEHEQELRTTEHPIQTGANVSDHAIVLPARVVFDIGMSDAMDAFKAGMWTGNQSKSVSCYQTMLQIQLARVPFTVTTKLRTYSNMVVESMRPVESNKTFTGLRMRITFKQIFVASSSSSSSSSGTSSPGDSSRGQTTGTTNLGTATTQPPTATENGQYNVPSSGTLQSGDGGGGSSTTVFTGTNTGAGVNGAGNWSSVNTNNLSQLLTKNQQ